MYQLKQERLLYAEDAKQAQAKADDLQNSLLALTESKALALKELHARDQEIREYKRQIDELKENRKASAVEAETWQNYHFDVSQENLALKQKLEAMEKKHAKKIRDMRADFDVVDKKSVTNNG